MSSNTTLSLAKLIFNISSLTFENSALRPNGNLLLTTQSNSSLLEIDPRVTNPQATIVTTFDGASVLGINSIGDDKYAVVGGFSGSTSGSGFTNNTVYTVDLSTNQSTITPTTALTIPEAKLLDGIATLPSDPNILLISDALLGVIYRIDLSTSTSSIVLNDTLLSGSGGVGVNGLKILNDTLYFVNTAAETYGRFAITEDGYPAGNISIIASGTDASADDFALDLSNGVAYLGRQEEPYAIVRVLLDGTMETIVEPDGTGRPDSFALTERGVGYVTTADGQVYEWTIPAL